VTPRSGVAYVAVDAITRGDPQALKRALVGLGLQHPAVYLNDVGGWLPLTAIETATRLTELHSMRAALSRTHAGAVTSQGDYVQGTGALRSGNPTLTGSGVKVGILSDSYNCYAVYAAAGSGVSAGGNAGYASNGFTADASTDITTGDLPASSNIQILEEAGTFDKATCMDFGAPYLQPYGDEGRAMMQIVHDVAPGAQLMFHTALPTQAHFASGIQALVDAGAWVIADDVTYFDEPFFQDGLVAQAANAAYAAGVAYFSSAGNSGSNAYDNTAPDFSNAAVIPAGEHVLNFDTSGASTTKALTVNLPQLVPGEFVALVLEWDQPYVTGAPGSGGATSRMDLCVTGSASGLIDPNTTPVTDLGNNTQICTGANPIGMDPDQILVIGFPANASATSGTTCPSGPDGKPLASVCSAAQTISIQVGLVSGTVPGRIKLAIEDDGAGSTFPPGIPVSGGTLQGHPGAAGVMAVGAVFWNDTPSCGKTPALLEYYSAKGGDPILFDSAGNAVSPAVMRQKPDIAGPDGGVDTFLGFVEPSFGSGGCTNSGASPNFFGTSAATPHVAATAALLLQQFPGINVSALYDVLKSGAQTIANGKNPDGSTADNYTSGYGFVEAQSALAAMPSAPDVTLTLSPTTVNTGNSATLSWTVTNATSCSASGAWTGTQQLSGSMMVTPTATGSDTYNLVCTNANGYTATAQVLTVTSSGGGGGGGGGGGAVDLASLAALAALAGACRRRRRS
jgi:subtilisin family serine protease